MDEASLVERAIKLHDEGKTWKAVAQELKISEKHLRKMRKARELTESSNLKPLKRSEIKVFISHRTADKPLAMVLRNAIVTEWELDAKNVFIDTDPEGGATPGSRIGEEIRSTIQKCHVFIHLFTKKDGNWEWVTQELAWAQDNADSMRVVTFQIYNDESNLRKGVLNVRLNENAIVKFVSSFFTKPNFVPGYRALEVADGADSKKGLNQVMRERGRRLFAQLEKTASEPNAKPPLQPCDKKQIKVFIGCRSTDSHVGQTLKNVLVEWGFLDENVETWSAVGPGARALDRSKKRFLWDCHLVLLVFTDPKAYEDWIPCTYELGIAKRPGVPTKIAVLLMLGEPPSGPFGEILQSENAKLYNMQDSASVQAFVYEFFRQPDFFPGYNAIIPPPSDSDEQSDEEKGRLALIRDNEERLRNAVEAEISEIRLDEPKPTKEEPWWGWFRIRISDHDMKACLALGQELKELSNRERGEKSTGQGIADKRAELRKRLRESLVVVEAGGLGIVHLGYNSAERATKERPTFADVVSKWRKSDPEKHDDDEWAQQLVDEIWRAKTNDQPCLNWVPFRSAYTGWPIVVVLTNSHIYADETRAYHVQVFRSPASDPVSAESSEK